MDAPAAEDDMAGDDAAQRERVAALLEKMQAPYAEHPSCEAAFAPLLAEEAASLPAVAASAKELENIQPTALTVHMMNVDVVIDREFTLQQLQQRVVSMGPRIRLGEKQRRGDNSLSFRLSMFAQHPASIQLPDGFSEGDACALSKAYVGSFVLVQACCSGSFSILGCKFYTMAKSVACAVLQLLQAAPGPQLEVLGVSPTLINAGFAMPPISKLNMLGRGRLDRLLRGKGWTIMTHACHKPFVQWLLDWSPHRPLRKQTRNYVQFYNTGKVWISSKSSMADLCASAQKAQQLVDANLQSVWSGEWLLLTQPPDAQGPDAAGMTTPDYSVARETPAATGVVVPSSAEQDEAHETSAGEDAQVCRKHGRHVDNQPTPNPRPKKSLPRAEVGLPRISSAAAAPSGSEMPDAASSAATADQPPVQQQQQQQQQAVCWDPEELELLGQAGSGDVGDWADGLTLDELLQLE
ncbi:hypothetical protein OEZ86_013076 [Tetradesmus obliquus]|nr:hypothetical protein OEZ86_013076 [Tetradesmus obliquus]